jgi:hypothetical protein
MVKNLLAKRESVGYTLGVVTCNRNELNHPRQGISTVAESCSLAAVFLYGVIDDSD